MLCESDDLVRQLEDGALAVIAEPDYTEIPSLDDYLANNYRRLSTRLQDARLRQGDNRRLGRAEVRYSDYLADIDAENDEINEQWRSDLGYTYAQACGIALICNDEDAASRYYEQARAWGAEPQHSDDIGLALLARGEYGRGKSFLRGARPEDEQLWHARNLVDAYRQTGDQEYRRNVLHILRRTDSYFIGRVVLHDLAQGRPVEDLFDAAGSPEAKLAVALLQASAGDKSSDAERYRSFIDQTLEAYRRPPKYLKPEPAASTNKAEGPQKRRWYVQLRDVALDVVDALFSGAEGSDVSPDYKAWSRNQAPILARLAPLIEAYGGYDASKFGPLGKPTQKTLLSRSNYGDREAGVRLLMDHDHPDAVLVYRNILHDFGPSESMHYVSRIPEEERGEAMYHTLLAFAIQGEWPERSFSLPEAKDTYQELKELYERASSVAPGATALASEDAPAAIGAGLEYEVTQYSMLSEAQRANLRHRIRALNDPAREKSLLERIVLPDS